MTEQTCKACDRPTSGAKLCEKCTRTLAISLPNVAAYYEDLNTIAGKATRYGSANNAKTSIGKEQPLPVDMRFINVPTEDGKPPIDGRAPLAPGSQLRWDVWNSVTTWARILMTESPRLHGPVCTMPCLHGSCATTRRRRWPTTNKMRSVMAYFDRQFRYITSAEWVDEFYDEMLDNENRMRRMIDRPADRWYAGKCSVEDEDGRRCETELYAITDKGTIDCPGCGIQHDVADRRKFLLAQAKDVHVTATEAAKALMAWTEYDGTEGRLVDQIQKWRDRDHLIVQDVTSLNGRDRHLYRLGDVQDLMIAAAQRAQELRAKSA